MLKEIPGRESLRHICDNETKTGIKMQALEIYLHDVQASAIAKNLGTFGARVGYIKYCPYCGVEIEKEERP